MTRDNKVKKFFLNPWTVGIGVALFGFLLTIIGDVVTGEKIFSTLVTGLRWLWNSILSFLNYNLKVWWVLIGICVFALGLWLYSKILDTKEPEVHIPPFLEYTQDYILGYKWEWTWGKDYYDKYSVENLHPICMKCETPLCDDYQSYYGLTCLRCKKSHTGSVPKEDHVKTLIYDNVKKRYFSRKEDL